ncbi:MAG: ABC transporter permease, partial [Sulfurimonas sp.]
MPIVSILILGFIFLFSFFGNYLYTVDAYALSSDTILVEPSLHHLLGTDRLGRDILARLIEGGKVSLTIGVG